MTVVSSRLRMTAVALCLAAVVAACSGGPTTDEYADSLGELVDGYVSESQALSFDYQSTVEDGVRDIVESGSEDAVSDATTLVARETIAYLAVLSDVMGRYLEGLDELTAPGAITDAHADFVAAVGLVYGAIPATRAAVAEAADLDGIQRALTASGFADGQLRWTAACLALEQMVRDEGRGIDLGCSRPAVGE